MPPKNRGINRQQITKKDSAKDDFWGIDEQQRLTHWSLHLLAGVLCIIFAIWVWMFNSIPQIHPDQINIVTMVLAKEHPENFARDTIYAGGAADFYPPLPKKIIAGFINKFGIIGGHRVAQFLLSVAYLFVMYAALYYLTGSVPSALLVALASIIWRWSLGETYWGLDRLQAVQPRSFVLVFIPALFVLFWKFRDSWKLLIPFFVTGLLFNLNPPSALYFIAIGWFSLFWVSLHNRDRILRLICAGTASIGGALPYIYVYMTTRRGDGVDGLTPQQLQEYVSALQYRFSQMSFFPLPASTWSKALMFGFAVPLLLATIGWCLRKEKRGEFDSWMVCFFLLSFVATVIGQYLMQQIYTQFKISPFLPNVMRGHKFAYLVLYIYTAWLLAELLRRFALREKRILIIVIALVVAVMPPFGNNRQEPGGKWRYSAGQARVLFRGEKLEIAGWHNSIAQVSSWAKQSTSEDSLFLFAHRFMSPFRIYALRSLVISQGGGDVARSNGPMAMVKWARYQQQIERITARQDISALLELASKSEADYIAVPGDFPKLVGWKPAMRDRFWTVYGKP